MDTIHSVIDFSTNLLSTGGILYGFLLVFVECFLPMLPLSAFIALNVNAFGMFMGIFISWIATCCGSYCVYRICSFLERKYLSNFLGKRKEKKIIQFINRFQNITFSELVLLYTLPFTPVFFVNIVCGITKVSKEKYSLALVIGKVFSTIFWAYIGNSFIVSLTDIYSLLYIGIALIVAYGISKIVCYQMNIN